MKFLTVLHIAIVALRRNLMRAFLTTLGIVIGVASVITMMELGKGSSRAIEKTVASMGANNLMVLPGTASSGGVSFGTGSVKTLTADDAVAILADGPAVKNAAPVVRARSQVVFGSRNWVPMFIQGTTPAFLDVRDWAVSEGEMFADRDVRNGSAICLIGKTLVDRLFDGLSPIGQELRVQNVALRVIGVLAPKGANMMGMDQDDILVAPWTTIKYRVSGSGVTQSSSSTNTSSSTGSSAASGVYPQSSGVVYPGSNDTSVRFGLQGIRFENVDQIAVAARSAGEISLAIKQITEILRERHRLAPEDPDDFNIRDMSEMTKAVSKTTGLLTKLLLSVALISLVVGGVGIMNIMLVSVTERTREIGLRMAVGARPRDILGQFLVEATVLCLSGGVIGILLGRGASLLVTAALGWPTESSLAAIIAAVSVSAVVGIAFGFYPAYKAAKLDPITALRYE